MEDDLPVSANGPLSRKLDNLLRRVTELDAAIFIAIGGHRGVWPSDEAVGSAVPDTDVELALILSIGLELVVLVDDCDEDSRSS